MSKIGGYLKLELHARQGFNCNAIALSSARNALVYVVKARALRRFLLPRFNCSAVVAAVMRFCPDTYISYYHVDDSFGPHSRFVAS